MEEYAKVWLVCATCQGRGWIGPWYAQLVPWCRVVCPQCQGARRTICAIGRPMTENASAPGEISRFRSAARAAAEIRRLVDVDDPWQMILPFRRMGVRG